MDAQVDAAGVNSEVPTAATLVQRYVALRNTKAQAKKVYESHVEKIDNELEMLEGQLLSMMNALGAESIRTEEGTVYKSTETYVSVADWEAVRRYIEETGYWHILNRAVNRKEVRELLEQHGETVPGVNIRREDVVNVRK